MTKISIGKRPPFFPFSLSADESFGDRVSETSMIAKRLIFTVSTGDFINVCDGVEPRKKPAKKAAGKSSKESARKRTAAGLLAKGGGTGPAAGVTFQGWVGALFAAIGLDQSAVDKRLQLAAESISEVRLETDSTIDGKGGIDGGFCGHP